jgi:cell division septal protein FtsQ
MALMLGKVYDALKAANIPDDTARAAAGEVATHEQVKSDSRLLKWMMGVLIALVLGVFWMQWQTVAELASVRGELTTVKDRVISVESKLESSS